MIWILSLAVALALAIVTSVILGRIESQSVGWRTFAAACVLLAVAAGALAFDAGGTAGATSAQMEPAADERTAVTATSLDARSRHDSANETVTVVDVPTGELVTVRHAGGRYETYRLAGIDAPRLNGATPDRFEGVLGGSSGRTCLERHGERTAVFVRTTLVGESVQLSTVAGDVREYAYLTLDGASFNRRLVEQGYARADGAYERAERRARTDNLGVWNCALVAPSRPDDASGIVVESIHPNPVGPDANDLNGEYFVIENAGSVTVDLENWYVTVGDGRTLFFGGRELRPGQEVTVHAGHGVDSPTDRYLGASSPILDNDHDTVRLHDGDDARTVNASY